jgi:hypothetical protein
MQNHRNNANASHLSKVGNLIIKPISENNTHKNSNGALWWHSIWDGIYSLTHITSYSKCLLLRTAYLCEYFK